MKCKYYGELKMHDGSVVPITDRRAAEKINAEFEWLFKKTSNDATTYTIRAVQCLFALKLGDRYGWTTDRGAVCYAKWSGEHFNGTAGAHAVAWREPSEPYEFWRDEVESDGRTDQHI